MYPSSREALVAEELIGPYSPIIGRKPPLSHPCNCKEECPYGYDKPFCFPCYKKIMEEHRSRRKG